MSFYRYFWYLKTAIFGPWKSLKNPWILSFEFAMNPVHISSWLGLGLVEMHLAGYTFWLSNLEPWDYRHKIILLSHYVFIFVNVTADWRSRRVIGTVHIRWPDICNSSSSSSSRVSSEDCWDAWGRAVGGSRKLLGRRLHIRVFVVAVSVKFTGRRRHQTYGQHQGLILDN